MRAALETARQDRLVVTLLAGDPGLGKSALLEAAAGEAQRAGMLVLRGAAFDAEGMPPYLPFLEALGGYARQVPPAVLRAQLGEHAAVLARLLPELPARVGETPGSYPLPAEQARLRLFDAVATWLGEIAQVAPLALERFPAGLSTAPIFVGLPDDRCQCPHWGYVIRGRVRVLYADHEETLRAGDAYYLAPGHTTVFEEDTEMVEFSPAGEYQKTMEVAIRNVTGPAV